MSLLGDYRVLDLTDARGHIAGFLLAQLGADVVLVESSDRVAVPLSLAEECYNRGKRSVLLDLRDLKVRPALESMVRDADVVITTGGPSELSALGIDYATLASYNPTVVHAAISAFGQTGPKADYGAPDLVALASGMLLWITGDEDRPPVRTSVPQAYLNAAIDAAGAALIALWERRRSEKGQLLDLSAQASLLQTTQCMALAEAIGATPAKRKAGGQSIPPLDVKGVWQCEDGFVTVTLMFGPSVGPFTERLVNWVREAGFLPDDLVGKDWIRFSAQISAGEEKVEDYERLKDAVQAFLLTKTKEELLREALLRELVVAPVMTIEDVAGSIQLDSRHYWEDVLQVDGSVDRYCGAIAKFSSTPLDPLPASPRRGEHTQSVFADAGRRRRPEGPPVEQPGSFRKALDNVRVLDFSWAMAGPGATRVLADHGAQIVRVESSHKPEACRHLQPFVDNVIDPDGSGVFLNMNAGKLGMSLNLNNPRSRDVVLDLVKWADLVCETFTPGTMERWGYGYDSLKKVNPRLVMFSSALMGQSGPLRNFAGYGNLSSALCGFYNVTGWPDRNPTGPYIAYTDYVAPRLTVPVLMAALEHQRRTGEGQWIDFSHAEASMHLLAPAFLGFSRSGHVQSRNGNLDERMAPHGVYPCEGDDRWIAIAIDSDQAWQSLCRAANFDATLISLDEFARHERAEELDGLVARWTAGRERDTLQVRLQRLGVAAHGVYSSADCYEDPQLHNRAHYVTTEHQKHGPVVIEGCRWVSSRTQPESYRAAPMLGQDTFEILNDILGYGSERIADLYVAGALD